MAVCVNRGSRFLTHHRAHKVVLCVYLQMVFQVRLSQKHTIAVLMRTAELLWLLVDLQMLGEFFLGREALATTLADEKEGGREGAIRRREMQ